MRDYHSPLLAKKHKGSALLIFILVVMTGALALIISRPNPSSRAVQSNAAALQAAKAALLAWGVTHPDQPGMLLYPDRRETSGPPNYDGLADCPTTASYNPSNLLGSLPGQGEAAPCTNARLSLWIDHLRDASPTKLWYAVSQNIVYWHASNDFPDISTLWLTANAPHPWLTLCDDQSIQTDIAFLLIAPGPPLPGQNRSGSAPFPQNFLDSVTTGPCGAQSNADSDPGRIFIAPSASATFNDQVLAITRDELIKSLVPRVAAEIRRLLNTAHTTYGSYPPGANNQGECVATGGTRIPLTDTTPDCGGNSFSSPPAWLGGDVALGWFQDILYTRISPNQVQITFSGCSGGNYQFNWTAGQTTMTSPSPRC